MSEIIVGLDGSPRGDDALAFARQIAELTGARLTLASAFPDQDPPSRTVVAPYFEYMRRDTVEMLERARAPIDSVDVRIHAVPDHSPARACTCLPRTVVPS
jgi:nucleotide-binding universal stress UspA family protein